MALAANYMGDAGKWPLLSRLNGIPNPRRIPIGFPVQIPVDEMRAQTGGARVIRIDGTAAVLRAAGRAAVRLSADDLLAEGDTLNIGPDSFVAIALADGSIVHVQADTIVRLATLRKLNATGASRSIFRLDKGRVDAIVKPVGDTGRFDVATPLAVAGVRGTNFGVGVRADGASLLDVIGGKVVFSSRNSDSETSVTASRNAVIDGSTAAPVVRDAVPAPDLASFPAQIERPVIGVSLPGTKPGATVRVQLALHREMVDVVQSRVMTAEALRFGGLPDGPYYLGLQTSDQQGNMSRQAVIPVRLWMTPVPPAPISPAAGSRFAGGVTVACEPVPDATVYDFELADSEGFAHLVAQKIGSATCTWELPPLAEGRYFWRATTVRKNSAGEMVRGPRGDSRDFTISPAAASPVEAASGSRR